MTTETVALSLMPSRSNDAIVDLIEDGQGILVSDGMGYIKTGATIATHVWPLCFVPHGPGPPAARQGERLDHGGT
jgi:hypothetical protein